MKKRLLPFPKPKTMFAPSISATFPQVLALRARYWVGWTLWKLGFPGLVCNLDITDSVTGQHIHIKTGPLFTKIQIDGRDYYFNQLTGRFDGTGMGCG